MDRFKPTGDYNVQIKTYMRRNSSPESPGRSNSRKRRAAKQSMQYQRIAKLRKMRKSIKESSSAFDKIVPKRVRN